MTKFLTDSDFAEIRGAIADVSETFLQKEVSYRLFRESMSRMSTDQNKSATYEDFKVMGLVVWSERKPIESRTGISDLSDGYLLLNIDQLKQITGEESGTLWNDEDTLMMNEGTDRVVIDGAEMKVLLVQPLGQLKDTEVVMKVFFEKQLNNI